MRRKLSEDAREARWIASEDPGTLEEEVFEDHFHILCGFLPQLPG